jgi:hypothetical protein
MACALSEHQGPCGTNVPEEIRGIRSNVHGSPDEMKYLLPANKIHPRFDAANDASVIRL